MHLNEIASTSYIKNQTHTSRFKLFNSSHLLLSLSTLSVSSRPESLLFNALRNSALAPSNNRLFVTPLSRLIPMESSPERRAKVAICRSNDVVQVDVSFNAIDAFNLKSAQLQTCIHDSSHMHRSGYIDAYGAPLEPHGEVCFGDKEGEERKKERKQEVRKVCLSC
jgi:hypothetical protein